MKVRMQVLQHIARKFFQAHALLIDLENGFPLGIHDLYPHAPLSPFYFDLRPLQSHPRVLDELAHAMAQELANWYPRPDLIANIPVSSVSLATLVSQKHQIPMITPRLDAKRHGAICDIDGVWQAGQTVLVLDDIRSTGMKKVQTLQLLRKHGLDPVRIFVVVDRGAVIGEPISGVPVSCLYTWDGLLEFYFKEGFVSQEVYRRIQQYPRELQGFLQKAT